MSKSIKKIINIHYQCSLPDPTPSATSHKINFQFLDFDTERLTYNTSLKQNDMILAKNHLDTAAHEDAKKLVNECTSRKKRSTDKEK